MPQKIGEKSRKIPNFFHVKCAECFEKSFRILKNPEIQVGWMINPKIDPQNAENCWKIPIFSTWNAQNSSGSWKIPKNPENWRWMIENPERSWKSPTPPNVFQLKCSEFIDQNPENWSWMDENSRTNDLKILINPEKSCIILKDPEKSRKMW